MSYNEKLDIHLNVPVHEIVDKIIDGLYQYNLTVEDLLEDEQEKVVEVEEELSNEDKESIDRIKTYHDKILSILNLQDEKLQLKKLKNFIIYCNMKLLKIKNGNQLLNCVHYKG